MARLPRLAVAGFPHHVIHRGNNRELVFRDTADHQQWLDLLVEAAQHEKLAVHAYVLMPDHVHLLATPETDSGLSRTMQAIGRRYVPAYNRRHGRRGALWEGRYRATLLQPERYLLPCMAYIDLNPVRAGLVARAADYPWSSHAHYAGLRVEKWLKPHPEYWQLGNTPFAREARYVELVAQGLVAAQTDTLGDAVLKGWALGDRAFLEKLQQQTARRLTRGKAGRPASSARVP
ncbi:MAG: transposase [Nevskiaceae bacterium]|nr:MAG: transposase [Nevskiaceae bacterium]